MKSEKILRIAGSRYFITAGLGLLAWVLNSMLAGGVFGGNKVLVSLLLIFVFCTGAVCYLVYSRGKTTRDRREGIALLILIGAFVIRFIYVLCMPYDISTHDMGVISQTPELQSGHLGYIGYIYHNGRLPDMDPTTVWSFYNPPLFYMLSAVWLKINTLLSLGWDVALENLQLLPLLFTMWASIGFDRLLKEFKVRGKSRLVLLAFFAFFPTFIWFSGSLTVDALVLFWMVHILLYTVRWYKKRDYRTIILLALCIGLGMFTKVSVGLLAAGTAFIFASVLIEGVRRDGKQALGYMKQFVVFGLICLPLGLFWSLRCYLLFDMPFSYVPDPNTPSQYLGDRSFWELWGIPSGRQLGHAKMLFDRQGDSNVWLTLIRNALYDECSIMEFSTVSAEVAGRILLYMQFPLILFMNGCYMVVLFGKKCRMILPFKVLTAGLYLLLMIGYISLFVQLPYMCTANFRYIAVAFVFPCLGTAVFFRNRVRTKLFRVFTIYTAAASALGILLYMQYCFL